jgi:hypothetical protein
MSLARQSAKAILICSTILVLLFVLKDTMQPSFNYVGSPDYRGYLTGLYNPGGTQAGADNDAGIVINYAGNDGGLDMAKVNNYAQTNFHTAAGQQGYVQGVVDLNNKFYNQFKTAAGGGGSGAASTGPTAAQKQQTIDFTNKAYDTKLSGFQSALDTLNPQEQAANLNIQNQWTNQGNSLQSQKAIGDRNLQMAGDQVQASKVKSLADLNRQIQSMGMSYNNQLGNYGAGDSTSADMIQRALSGQASKNRANVMSSAAQQGNQIELQKGDLQTEFQNNMKSLDDWKSSSLNDIATKFMQQRQQIQQSMIGANADRYQALASLDQNYVNQAIQQLGNLQAQYQQNANDLVSKYQNIQGPNVAIAQNLQQYAVNPISSGQIGQLSMAPTANNGNGVPIAAQRRPFEQDYGFGLGA